MRNNFKSKEDIRQEVNIVDYALLNGYLIDKEGTTTNWVKLINETTSDKILVKTKNNLYSNLGNDGDRGDILQFVANRLNGSLNIDKSNEAFYAALLELNKYLGNTVNQSNPILADKEKYFRKKETLLSVQDKEWNHKPIENFNYLTRERGIDLNTLKLPLFEGKLFNTYFSLGNGHIITNTAFGKTINNKLVGLEVRNKTIKSILGNHDGVFYTNVDKTRKIDGVFYAESVIDIASYIELLYNNPSFEKNKNYCFVSFSGNLYESKLNNIINDLEKMQLADNCKFISLTDNDSDKIESKKAGKIYDVLLTATLINKFISPLNYDVNDTFFKFTFTKKDDLNIENIKSVFEKQAAAIDKEFDLNNRFGKYVVLKENVNSLEINIPKGIDLKQSYFQEFLESIKASRLYIPHKPKGGNDWNEELKRKKNIIEKEESKNTNEKKKTTNARKI